jgi:SAM-dependent methyltransferase
MAKYHKYIFDSETRSFVGNFEEMYQREDIEKFDSWEQNNVNHMTKKLAMEILSGYNFNSIIDFGCGKGAFTNLLRKNNNSVIGIDISYTALAKAKLSYPLVDFQVGDAEYLSTLPHVDLIVAIEVFSYIHNWREIIEVISKRCTYFFITVYIPPNPIGFIKSIDELKKALTNNFSIVTELVVNNDSSIFFLKSQ